MAAMFASSVVVAEQMVNSRDQAALQVMLLLNALKREGVQTPGSDFRNFSVLIKAFMIPCTAGNHAFEQLNHA